MDFSALQQGVMIAVTAVASVTFSIPQEPPSNGAQLSNPEIISSYNLPQETTKPESLQNLNSITQTVAEPLKMVIKEAQASEIVTVEQPPVVFTVTQPSPKPSPSEESEEDKEESEATEAKNKEKADAEKTTESKPEDKKPEASSTPIPTPSPTTSPIALSSSNAEVLFQMTNDHRAKIGKPALEKEERLCKIAEGRAPQVKTELASGTLHKGFKELNLPYWATENIAAYSTMKENFNFLVTDYIHKKAIESDAKYSCTACTGTSCSQIFSSFVPK